MPEQNDANTQTNIEEDAFKKTEDFLRDALRGGMLRNALDFVAYLKESGRTCKISVYPNSVHPMFHYMGEFTCLFACFKDNSDQSDQWFICCWEGECDLYEPDGFPMDESLKEFARENVKKCFNCGGCDAPLGPVRRTIFGKEYDDACCNIFHFHNPDCETLEKIIKLMELQKHVIAESKKSE